MIEDKNEGRFSDAGAVVFFKKITDDAVGAFKERRQNRLKAHFDAEDDVQWITIHGAHIPIGDDGELQGKVGREIQRHAEEAKEREESAQKKEPVSKRKVNQKLNGIADSDISDEEKIKALSKEFSELRNGTKIIMPDSWDSDDGKHQT